MKKFILFLCLTFSIAFLFPTGGETAFADNAKYLRVITSDTPFYKNQDDTTALFYLPYTYYVKVLYDNGEFVHIECYGDNGTVAIDGFVPKEMLFDDELQVTEPFANLKIKSSTNAVLYADSQLSTPLQYIFPERDMCYYGTLDGDNGNLYFVGYNGRLGYVKESEVYPFTLPNHPNQLTFLGVETESDEQNQEVLEQTDNAQDFFSLKIIIIVCLLFAGLISLFVALKTKPFKVSPSGYYDENEYE